MPAHRQKITLEIASRLDLADLVQTALARLAGDLGFDEDAIHYMSVAVRESVVNAIRHGNAFDESKRVGVEFVVGADAINIEISDEGRGFEPATIPNPLACENLLRADGRGIFFMRSFMDELSFSFPPRGGTVVRMVKRLGSPAVHQEPD